MMWSCTISEWEDARSSARWSHGSVSNQRKAHSQHVVFLYYYVNLITSVIGAQVGHGLVLLILILVTSSMRRTANTWSFSTIRL
jgi:hypothetical protein